jgi:phosphate transport system substrate-binding protein
MSVYRLPGAGWRKAVFALSACLIASTAPAQGPPPAEAVLTIRATTGSEHMVLVGRILGFDGEFLTIDTIYGPFTLAAEGLDCVGMGCPDIAGHVGGFSIGGSVALGTQLLPGLVEAWAERRGLSVVSESGSDAVSTSRLLVDPATGALRAEIVSHLGRGEDGLIALLTGSADLALTFDTWRGAGARSRIVAMDALVPLVAPGNPVRSLSIAALAGVLSGRIADWSELGGPRGPIMVHLGPSDTGLDQIQAGLLPATGIATGLRAVRHDNEAALAAAVAADAQALGLGRWSQRGPARALALGGGCGILIRPDIETIRSEDWPLALPVQVYLRPGRPVRDLRSFLAFLSSPEAREAVRRAGLADLSPAPRPLGAQGDRLAAAVLAAGPDLPLGELQTMVRHLSGASRLAYSFRFETGSASLDAISGSLMQVVAAEADTGGFDGRRLIFAGFTDSAGNARANQRLSLQRARAAAEAFVAALGRPLDGRLSVESLGFGQAMPIACDDTELGRNLNRRVELWLR